MEGLRLVASDHSDVFKEEGRNAEPQDQCLRREKRRRKEPIVRGDRKGGVGLGFGMRRG